MKLLIFVTLVTLTFGCQKQPAVEAPIKCNIKSGQIPDTRGLRLGMSLADIQKRFPNLRLNPDEFGNSIKKFLSDDLSPEDIYLNDIYFSIKQHPELKDIKSFTLEFVDDRIVQININYGNNFQWKSEAEYISQMQKSFGLKGEFQAEKLDGKMIVECDDFGIALWGDKSDYLLGLRDKSLSNLLSSRKQTKTESFKP